MKPKQVEQGGTLTLDKLKELKAIAEEESVRQIYTNNEGDSYRIVGNIFIHFGKDNTPDEILERNKMTKQVELPKTLEQSIEKFLTYTWGWTKNLDGEWYDSVGEPIGGITDLKQFIAQAQQEAVERFEKGIKKAIKALQKEQEYDKSNKESE